MTGSFSNKTYIVFGGSSGIGEATTFELLNRRANVVAVSDDKAALLKVVAALIPIERGSTRSRPMSAAMTKCAGLSQRQYVRSAASMA